MDDWKVIFKKNLEDDSKLDLFNLYYGMTLPEETINLENIKLDYIKEVLLQPYRYLYTNYSNIKIFSKKPDDEKLFDFKLTISNIKQQNPLWKYSLKTEYINPVLNPEKIISYKPIAESDFFFLLETLNVIPLLDRMRSSRVGIFSRELSFFEPIFYYLKGDIKNKYEFELFRNNLPIQFTKNEDEINDYKTFQNKFDFAFQRLISEKKNFSVKTVLELNENDVLFKNNEEKKKFENRYDLLFLELNTINQLEIIKYSIELSVPFIFYMTLQFLPTLKDGGNLFFTPISATPLFIDFVSVLEMAFERVEFYNPKTRRPSEPFFSNFVCCLGYKKDFDKKEIYKKVMDELSKLDTGNEYIYKLSFIKKDEELKKVELVKNQPNLKNNLFKNQPNKFTQYRKSPKQPNYLYRIFGKKKIEKMQIYNKFYDYLKVIYSDYIIYQEKADDLFKNMERKGIQEILNKTVDEVIEDGFSSLSNSIDMANFLDLKLKKNYKEIKNKNLHKIILEGFFNETPHFFKQKIINNKLLKKNSNEKPDVLEGLKEDELIKVNAVYDTANMILDRVDVDEWDKIRDKVHYFRRQLKGQLEDERQTVNISQAGIKMWELLMNFELIPRGKKEVKSFHICELPGSFIYATDLFIKTQRPEVKEWLFLAQSLWISDKSKFDDSFHLVRDYPGVYDFGPKKTGDITDIDNIIYYSNRLKGKGLNLITSDCGVSPNDPNPKIQILFASILIVLFCSSKGTNFIQKLYPPITEAHFNLFLLCAKWFKDFYISKPSVNKQQTEFYIVGMGFKENEMPDEAKEELIKHYRKDKEATELKIKADKEAIESLGDALEKVAAQFGEEQEKTAEIVNFWHLFTKEEKERIVEFGRIKRHEWIESNLFPRIPEDGTFLIH